MKMLMRATGRLPEEKMDAHSSIRMNWIVTADESGRHQLRMCWRLDREDQSIHRKSLTKIISIDSVPAAPNQRRVLPVSQRDRQ